jgi:hypothetical protein
MLTILRKRQEATAATQSPDGDFSFPILPPGKAEVRDLEDLFYTRKTTGWSSSSTSTSGDASSSTTTTTTTSKLPDAFLNSPSVQRLKLKEEDLRLLLLYTNTPEKYVTMTPEGGLEKGYWVEDIKVYQEQIKNAQ